MNNRKIILLLYVLGSLLVWFLSHESVNFLYGTVAWVRRLPQINLVREALPVALGAGTFLFLSRYSVVNIWMDEVVSEVRKVVWPTKDIVYRSTTVVIIFVMVASIILAIFDLGWGKMISWALKFRI